MINCRFEQIPRQNWQCIPDFPWVRVNTRRGNCLKVFFINIPERNKYPVWRTNTSKFVYVYSYSCVKTGREKLFICSLKEKKVLDVRYTKISRMKLILDKNLNGLEISTKFSKGGRISQIKNTCATRRFLSS